MADVEARAMDARRDAEPDGHAGGSGEARTSQPADPHAETHASGPGEARASEAADPFAETHASGPRARATDPLAATADGSEPRSDVPDPCVGRTLAHFRVDAPLGRGGMGAVYRGWDSALERPVAIKVLTIDHPQARERFLREARAQAKVRHPNVVPIHFVGEADGVVFLSMDLVAGASVADRLHDGPLLVDEALDIVSAVADALSEGQRSGLVHRDVKPSNVLRSSDGRVLLADFGLAKAVGAHEASGAPSGASDPSITHHGAIVGTPAYMAPEQTRSGPLDHRADMYALGVTLYEMLTGQRPFTAPDAASLLLQQREEVALPPRSLAPALPPAVDALVMRLLEKDPSARFADYASLRRAIDEARVRPAPSAGVFARAGAMVIDLLAGGFVALLVSATSEPSIAIAWPVVAVLWGLAEARWGKTLGKRLYDLRVVAAHDLPPRPLRAVWRNLLKDSGPIALGVLSLLPEAGWVDVVSGVLFLLWLASFALAGGSKKLALHDRLAGTRVAYHLR